MSKQSFCQVIIYTSPRLIVENIPLLSSIHFFYKQISRETIYLIRDHGRDIEQMSQGWQREGSKVSQNINGVILIGRLKKSEIVNKKYFWAAK